MVIPSLKVISWNVNHRAATWSKIRDFDADLVLLQEATPAGMPDNLEFQLIAPPTSSWKIANAPKKGTAATAIVVNWNWDFESRSEINASHPGQFSIAYLPIGSHGIYFISLYGILESNFADDSLHRAISDLSPILESKAEVLVAGDLNSFRGYAITSSKKANEQAVLRHAALFERFQLMGLECIGPFSTSGPLENCPCNNPDTCDHVHTYRYKNRDGERAFQNDYVFATKGIRKKLVSCKALTDHDKSLWQFSDHAPIETIFDY